MSDFFDFLEFPDDVDLDLNGVPDIHETQFVNSYDGVVPDALNPEIDLDGDGVPDHADGHVDIDGNGLDYRTSVDSGGDGLNDWDDPYSSLTGTGFSSELQHYEAIQHFNPHFRS